MLIKRLLLKLVLSSIIISPLFNLSCSKKIFSKSHYHSNVTKGPKSIPSNKCFAWFKIDSKKHLQKKAYGLKYSEKVSKKEKNVFE